MICKSIEPNSIFNSTMVSLFIAAVLLAVNPHFSAQLLFGLSAASPRPNASGLSASIPQLLGYGAFFNVKNNLVVYATLYTKVIISHSKKKTKLLSYFCSHDVSTTPQYLIQFRPRKSALFLYELDATPL